MNMHFFKSVLNSATVNLSVKYLYCTKTMPVIAGIRYKKKLKQKQSFICYYEQKAPADHKMTPTSH